jgi:hypothetical protein
MINPISMHPIGDYNPLTIAVEDLLNQASKHNFSQYLEKICDDPEFKTNPHDYLQGWIRKIN